MNKDKLFYVLQDLRKRPELYLRENDIMLLEAFIGGYFTALGSGYQENCFLRGFTEFCSDTFNDKRNINWAHFISEYASKEDGLPMFFSLLDKFLESGTLSEIMAMLDKKNNPEIQKCGVKKARSKPVSLFMMPYGNEDAWENCALVVCEKNNQELKWYSDILIKWAGEEDKPGSKIIFHRLISFKEDTEFLVSLKYYIRYAESDAIRKRLSELLSSCCQGTDF